ncbi:hydroxyethylthiazole kinase [Vibrio palustris]|uniref:Hydroxyethylthiazole kinase n=1 Tax=Vibrio palustris TaxID=1918946 RepID=A0A1R4B375_9VIBR|nr:hydroxyethylthiazole kinase [Vibrio palustris]SJL83356.1 Hydroxyethylthiazole kinase [Vibrio palustris]
MDVTLTLQTRIVDTVEVVRQTNPMAGSVTNSVTMNFVANAQLAVGGSAAMVYLADEAVAIAKAGGASYINFGTFEPFYVDTLPQMAHELSVSNKPWVIDPVGIGIGGLRTQILTDFKAYKPSIIRGNASEVIALANLWGLDAGNNQSNVRGVDAQDAVDDARAAAIAIAKWTNGAVAVSGERDLITDGYYLAYSSGGSHFMNKITGAGCSLGGVMAVYATSAPPFIAALTGAAIYNLAGQRAEETAYGPASFQEHFLDHLYRATAQEVASQPFTLEVLA